MAISDEPENLLHSGTDTDRLLQKEDFSVS